MPIKEYTIFRCLLPLSAKKKLVQAILQESILHYSRIKPPRKGTERIYHILIQCTTDPLRGQCIKVRAYKSYIQSKKNISCMQYCKPRHLFLTVNITRDFAQE